MGSTEHVNFPERKKFHSIQQLLFSLYIFSFIEQEKVERSRRRDASIKRKVVTVVKAFSRGGFVNDAFFT